MRTSSLRLVRAGTFACLLASHSAQAATQYAGGSFIWDNGSTAAWGSSGGPYTAIWTSGNDAVIEGAAGIITISNPTAHNLTFNTTGYILSGTGTLTLNGTTPTISTGPGISAVIGDNMATVITGNAGLTKAGTGTLTLNGSTANTFTGTLTLNGGTLALDFANLATPTNLLNSAVIPNGGGGTLLIKGQGGGGTTTQTLGIPNSTQGYASKILADPNGGTVALTMGTIADNFTAKTKTGRILMLGKAAGATGTFSLTTVAGSGGRILYTPDGGATANYWGTSGPATTTVYAATGGATSSYYTISGSLVRTAGATAGGLQITPTGPGQSLSLPTGVSQTASVLLLGSDAYTISGAAGAEIRSPDTNGGSQLAVHVFNPAGLTISTGIHGAGGSGGTLFKNGPGPLTLAGQNLYQQTTWIAEGSIILAAAQTGSTSGPLGAPTVPANSIFFSGGALEFTPANTYDYSPRFSTAAGQPVRINTGGQNVTFATALTSSGGSLTKQGPGTLTLGSASSSFSGQLTVETGNLAAATINDAGTNGPLGNSTLPVILGKSGGTTVTLEYTGGTAGSTKPFTLATDGTGAFQVDAAGTELTLGGVIGGGGGLTKTGPGTLILSTVNTYTGNTTVNAGTLVLGAAGSIDNSARLAITAGATYDVSAIAAYTLSAATTLSAAGTASAATIKGAADGTVSLGSQAVALTWTGVSSGSDNTHPPLTVSQGVLELNNNTFTVVVPGTALGAGTYTLVHTQQNVTGTVNPTPSYTGGNGVAGGMTPGIVTISGSDVVLTVTADTTDTMPPTPDPMTFASAPAATGPYAISMTAATASDPSGVEYSFTCTAGGGHHSGWQDSTTYIDTGLTPSTLYSYTVTARDKALAQNATAPSTVASAITEAADTTPPTPDPMTFAYPPAATGAYSITMTATTASDPNGVEYFFTCTAGGGHHSGWQDSAIYQDTGLTPGSPYAYTITARDKSPALNITLPSAEASATTDAPDTTPPTPDPMTFASPPAATGPFSISMTAATASDPNGVQYSFTCTAGGGHHSGWQDSPTFEDTGLTQSTSYTYAVTARDKSPAQNVTSPSADASATTTGLTAAWDGSALDTLWSTVANWTPAYVPNAVGASAVISRALLFTPGASTTVVVTGTTVTLGQLDIESNVNPFSVDLNGGGTGKIVFDNGGANAVWNVETSGSKNTVTVKGSGVGYVLSDNLVITSRSDAQFRPPGTLTDATGESHSVTYTSDMGATNQGFKLAWTATNTGGTIVDAGQLRADTSSLDSRIGVAASGPDLLLKNGGRIFVGENQSHNLSRTVEIGAGGGKFISDALDSLTFSGVISGAGELTISKTGTGVATVYLTGTAANTVTGNVVLDNPQPVTGQELLVVADKVGAFGLTPLLKVGDHVILQIKATAANGQGAIDDAATRVQLQDVAAVIDVAAGLNEKVWQIEVFNGTAFTPVAAGTYDKTQVSWITGDGSITVLNGAGDSAYANWAGIHAGGGSPDEDADHDGVANGVEFFMNVTTAGFTPNPAADAGNIVTWTNGGNIPDSAYGTRFVVQTSTNLRTWTDVAIDDPNLANTTGAVSYTLTGTAKQFARLVVTPN